MFPIRKTLAALSLIIVIFVLFSYRIVYRPNLSLSTGLLGRVEVKKGDDLRTVARNLEEAKLIDDAERFIWACRLMRVETGIPAGIFTIPYGLSNRELVMRMMYSSTNTGNITIREGWTAAKIAKELHKKIGIDSVGFLKVVNDQEFVKEMGLEAPSLEGYLFPETYNLYLGMDPKEAAGKMVEQFRNTFDDKMKFRAFELGFSVNQIVTLASIVEGEIIYSSEAPIVSGVYHNRLKVGMRLQADPTVQYIIPDSPRRLRYSDLKIESPYNTYRNKGLPPGPIGNPGYRALMGALYPADVPYIYFVAKGDGYHNFNVTSEEHIADKNKFDRYRRKVRNQKKAKKQQ